MCDIHLSVNIKGVLHIPCTIHQRRQRKIYDAIAQLNPHPEFINKCFGVYMSSWNPTIVQQLADIISNEEIKGIKCHQDALRIARDIIDGPMA